MGFGNPDPKNRLRFWPRLSTGKCPPLGRPRSIYLFLFFFLVPCPPQRPPPPPTHSQTFLCLSSFPPRVKVMGDHPKALWHLLFFSHYISSLFNISCFCGFLLLPYGSIFPPLPPSGLGGHAVKTLGPTKCFFFV